MEAIKTQFYDFCPVCHGIREGTIDLKEGDKVNFTQVRQVAGGFEASNKTGKIVQLGEEQSIIKSRGRNFLKDNTGITHPESKNGLTVAFTDPCKCGGTANVCTNA